MTKFFTIGHSNRTIEQFVACLKSAGVTCVVDIRSLPGSRAQPQFDQEVLAPSLEAVGLGYRHMPALGGLRKKTPGVPADENGFWCVASFHRYADYATTPAFHAALADLIAFGSTQSVALMCAEAVWWRCHRRIVADHLLAAGFEVVHIMGEDKLTPAQLTAGAHVDRVGLVTYPTEHASSGADLSA